MARQLAAQGARLAICARDRDELARAVAELSETGVEILPLVCDVTQKQEVDDMVAKVRDRLGPIDVLINNAGQIEVGPMTVMNLEDYEAAMNLHFWGPLYTTLAVLPEMRQQRRGRIVNISSIGGKVSVPHLLPYSASKFALTGLSEGMRSELAREGIFVTTVCPGLIRTGSAYHALFKGQHRAEHAWFSVSSSLPFFSISAEAAAREILAACRRGEAELVLSLPAWVADKFHGLFPGLAMDLLGWVNQLLPEANGIGQERMPGKNSHSSDSPSALTVLADEAARRNNEIPIPVAEAQSQ